MLTPIKELMLFCLFGTIGIICSCSNTNDGPLTRAGVFQTPVGDAMIEGELFLPDGDGPFPSMIIIGGSGNDTREIYEPFASVINQNGYALYIYDKRGVGNSTGSYPAEIKALITARTEDITGILALLNSHSLINNERIGLYGESQGAWINSKVYENHPSLAYMIMASGGVASTGLEGYYCSLTDDANITIEEAISALDTYDGDMGFDPLPTLERMELPVLWIYGLEDRSHPARYDIDVLESLNKSNFTVIAYENTDHALIDLTTMQRPMSFISDIDQWLLSNN